MRRNPNCKLCPLHKEAHTVCLWGEGSPKARLMILGEAPGREEDMVGRPFIGKSGKLLDYILETLGIDRKDIYSTNAVKCRPPDNKLPTRKGDREEVLKACRGYWQTELAEHVRTNTLLVLGATALQAVSGHADIMTWQGRVVSVGTGGTIYTGVHPAYVLRNPHTERLLAVAIYRAAHAAGIKIKWGLPLRWFDYGI